MLLLAIWVLIFALSIAIYLVCRSPTEPSATEQELLRQRAAHWPGTDLIDPLEAIEATAPGVLSMTPEWEPPPTKPTFSAR